MKVRLTGKARALRRRETEEETILWRHLRNRQMNSWKFRRQVPRGPYVVDFLCVEAGLVIELDGSQHRTFGVTRDEVRTRALESDGLRVLRFDNVDVLSNLEGVLDEIYRALGEQEAPSPGALRLGATRRPLPEGRGDAEASRPTVANSDSIESNKINPDAQRPPSPLGEMAGMSGSSQAAPQSNAAETDGAIE